MEKVYSFKGANMFGYILVNKSEMKFKDYDSYRSFYCGLCRELKQEYGIFGQATLSYDMTFLLVLLTGLYEPQTERGSCKCVAHPFEKHITQTNEITRYAADMNVLLTYLKYQDDWADDRQYKKYISIKLLESKYQKIELKYQEKAERISALLNQLYEYEKAQEEDIDIMSGFFGEIMAEIFIYRQDEWKDTLYRMGFYLGKFVYLMDAYEDIEEDLKKSLYNPFRKMYNSGSFEEECQQILTMMMAECSREFEKLPILEHIDILRNVLYSGVWCRYDVVSQKRRERQEKADAGSI